MWKHFATSRNASLGFRKWGVGDDGYYHPAGGNNAEFIHRMFDYMRNNSVEFQADWNVESAGGGTHRLWPEDETTLANVGDAFRTEALVDLGSRTDDGSTDDGSSDGSTEEALGDYNQPSSGTLNWHVPMNESFANIETEIKSLDQRLKNLE